MRAVLLLMLVSGVAWAQDAGVPPPKAPVPLRDALIARAGGSPVVLAYGEEGLAAAPMDRKWSVTLVDGAVAAAALDAALDLLWIVREGTLEVVDLREPMPVAVPIVARWAVPVEGAYANGVFIDVSGWSTASTDTTYAGVFPVLKLGAKPKVATGEGAYAGIWEDQDAAQKKAIKKAKLVGGAWLAAQAGRKPHAVKTAKAGGEGPRVSLPEGMGDCEEEELCGSTVPFGATGLLLVTVSHTCGDACHTQCLLWDPAKKKLADPGAPEKWGVPEEKGACLGYVFDGSGTRWLAGDAVCSTKGCVSMKLGGNVFDWLEGHGARL